MEILKDATTHPATLWGGIIVSGLLAYSSYVGTQEGTKDRFTGAEGKEMARDISAIERRLHKIETAAEAVGRLEIRMDVMERELRRDRQQQLERMLRDFSGKPPSGDAGDKEYVIEPWKWEALRLDK